MSTTLTEAGLRRAKIGAYFRPRDVAKLGVSFHELRTLVAQGEVEKVARGLYRLVSFAGSELETVAMVGRAIPNGIICLLTALRIHGIGTQSPHEVWIAIDRKAREPKAPGAKLRVVRFSGRMLDFGVQTKEMLGVPVKITSPARTVVDCFRYRRKFGLDVALEAMRDAVRRRRATTDEIMRAAEACRARTVLSRYLEAL